MPDYLSSPIIASKRFKFVVGYMREGVSRGLFLLSGWGDYVVWVWRWGIRVGKG